MMKQTPLLLILLFAITTICNSQDKDGRKSQIIEDIIDPVETWPSFPGGEKALFCFIYHNLDTIKLKNVNKRGFTYSQFIVDTTGKIWDVKILRGIESIADNELIRIIKLMPPWNPALQAGKKVKVLFNLPLKIPYENKFCR